MSFDDKFTHYEILELLPDATSQEVQAAYARAKSAYTRDNVALYTLVSASEREDALKKIEEAYSVLSDPHQRAEYDRCHGVWTAESPRVVSIDRTPPMLATDHPDENLLVAPSTGFDSSPFGLPPETIPGENETKPASPKTTTGSLLLEEQIAQEVEWHGSLIRRVREAKGISIEEMAAHTKISKSNILAIEEENFAKFPAPVYLRGFVSQIAKVLKLPHDRVAAAYIARYNQSNPKQNK